MNNPLLKNFILPPFNEILLEHLFPALKKAITNSKNITKNILLTTNIFTWDNLYYPLSEADNNLNKIWSIINHLNAVKNNQMIRKIYKKSLLLISSYNNWVSHNKNLYKAYKNLLKNKFSVQLNHVQKKAIDIILINFKLSGINLNKIKQNKYNKIILELSELESKFNNNVLDSSKNWNKLIINEKELSGIPNNIIYNAKKQAIKNKQIGWLITLDIPTYLAVMTYSNNILLRKEMYKAFHTRASDQGPNAGKWNNEIIINRILLLRYELSNLLGFHNYLEQSLITKMAKNPITVFNFINNLIKLIKPKAILELNNLKKFALKNFNCSKIEPWDILFYNEKQKEYLFKIDNEQVKLYFPENTVLNGLFKIINNLFNVTIKEKNNIQTWHKNVRFYDVIDSDDNIKGSFYLDLYSRKNKREGAWMDSYVTMMKMKNGTIQIPIAFLICNFNIPINNQPILFTHNEVNILFHEIGHVLHHILTKIDIPSISGINGIPWDVVELPSQFMESYSWEEKSLKLITYHVKSNNVMPKKLINNLLKSQKHNISLFFLRQLELSLFDFEIHCNYKLNKKNFVLETLKKIKQQTSVIDSENWERFPHTFSHIFSGGYSAGYYSYLWADVLAKDIWLKFKEEGILNYKIGKLFLDTILSKGGSEDPINLFKKFRGRNPDLNIMLNYYDIINT